MDSIKSQRKYNFLDVTKGSIDIDHSNTKVANASSRAFSKLLSQTAPRSKNSKVSKWGKIISQGIAFTLNST